MTAQALLLSIDHRIYRGAWHEGEDLTAIVQRFANEGLAVSPPVGVRPPRFVLQLEGPIPGEREGDTARNPDWVSLSSALSENDELWEFYCEALLGGWYPPRRSFDVVHFGVPGATASRLAHLVTKGSKRGTAGWIRAYQHAGLPLPESGRLAIVTDGFGLPVACIETESVEALAFRDVTDEMARREGEATLTLAEWKHAHWRYWTEIEAPVTGLSFSEDELVFVESFRLLHVFAGRAEHDRPDVVCLVGPTGSGKTTLGRRIASERRVQLHSIDEWMRALFWMDAPSSPSLDWALERCRRCEHMVLALVRAELANGRGAVLDMGFSTRAERAEWRQRLEALGARVSWRFVDAPREERWRRVQARNARLASEPGSVLVDRETFDWMEGYFEPPSLEEESLAPST